VTAENASAFFLERDIDGALVGGASLDAAQFCGIVEAAQAAAQAKKEV
jgi:triosephosphate isomerase